MRPTIDTLLDFHLHTTSPSVIESLGQIITLLQQRDPKNPGATLEKINQLLTQPMARRVFHLMCETFHVDEHAFIDAILKGPLKRHAGTWDPARLVLQLICYRAAYGSNLMVSDLLDIDVRNANLLIDELKHTFTLDNPLQWLQNLYRMQKQIAEHQATYHHNQLLGKVYTNAPADTAEERRVKKRKNIFKHLHPDLF